MPFAAVAALACASAFAGAWDDGNTWFVATNGADVAASSGGGTEAAPFRTLQFAHDQASAGDTIKLAPGVYAEGEVGDGKHTNRLVVAKKLRFRSTDGKAKTVIEGRLENGSYGLAAVRCVSVKSTGYDCEFHDLTFRNGGGGTNSADSVGASCGLGGCIYVAGSRDAAAGADHHRAYFVDCDIVGGVTRNYGGGMYGGTAIRCLIRDCKGNSWGSSACAAMLWNCVVFNDLNTSGTGNSSRPAIGFNAVAVNCTVYGARRSGCDRNARLYNTFIVNSGTYDFHSYKDSWAIQRYNCVGGSETNDLYQLISPATGDFRPIAGKPIVGGGLTSYLNNSSIIKLPEGTEMTDFNGNLLDLESETCNVGAVQGAGVTPATGRITVNSGMRAEGWLNGVQNAYSYAESFPATLVIRPASETCMRLQTSKGYSKLGFIYPQYDGTAHVGYPHDVTQYRSFSEVEPKATFWTDPAADAGTADGTEEHPFRTLQAAVDHIVASNLSSVVVNAKPGVYAEGGAVMYGVTNRVVLPADRAILLRSTGGAAVTTIRGASDPNSASELFPGCGSAAVRCVAVGNLTVNSALQGFTFADGRTDCVNAGTKIAESDAGAGVCNYEAEKASVLLQVLDCTFTNCVAPYRAAAIGGFYTRCRFTHCTAWGGLISNCHLSGCLTDETCTLTAKPTGGVTDDGRMFPADSRTLHCTILNGTVYNGTSNQRYSFSTLFYKSSGRGGNYFYYGSIFDTTYGSGSGSAGYLKADIDFADPEHGDYRLLTGSEAEFAGILPEPGGDYYGVWETCYSELVSSGLDGKRIRYRDGVPLAGCYQTTAASYNIQTSYGGVKVTGVPEGIGVLPDDAVITVAPDAASATRPCFRYVINGETNELATAQPKTFTADELAATKGIAVEALYEPHWYVNPDPLVGDDDNDGFTRETPKKTLAALFSGKVLSGDTVHAAPGVYAEGEMLATATAAKDSLKCRAAIPSGVTLVSDEGADRTVIVGSRDRTEGADPDGLGTNAIRGVYMGLDSVVKGFTFTGCYTRFQDDAWTGEGFNYCGGAIRSADASKRAQVMVYDCVFSNNWAHLGAGVMGVSAVRCTFRDNHAQGGASAAYVSNLYGSTVDWNYSGETSSQAGVYSFGILCQSTFGSHNWNYTTNLANRAITGGYSTAARISGILVLGTVGSMGKMTNVVENSVFANGDGSFKCNDETCFVGSEKSAEWADAEMRPIIGANPGIDRALAEDLEIPGLEKDATGFQRVMNGAPDIGALEADWRGRYAEDILGRKFAVEAADKMVEETESRSVLVPEGTSLVGEILNKSACETPYLLKFVVPEGGSLTVTVGGQATDYAAGTYEITVNATAATLPVSFAATAGTAAILRGKSLAGTLLLLR